VLIVAALLLYSGEGVCLDDGGPKSMSVSRECVLFVIKAVRRWHAGYVYGEVLSFQQIVLFHKFRRMSNEELAEFAMRVESVRADKIVFNINED
jgi:hypothetical protein